MSLKRRITSLLEGAPRLYAVALIGYSLINRVRLLISGKAYFAVALLLLPVNLALALVYASKPRPRSVAHFGAMFHPHAQFVEALRANNIDAVFFGIGPERRWSTADHHLPDLQWFGLDVLRDMWVFWRYVVRYEVIHCHAMNGLSHYQWEFLVLKLLGRRIVAHFRGCEGRSRQTIMACQPHINICQECDYSPRYLCEYSENRRRRKAARHFADAVLVTTPDLIEHWPHAEHVRFFLPSDLPDDRPRPQAWSPDSGRRFQIVHITDQPGIEGTELVRRILADLRHQGLPIDFQYITGVPHHQVYEALTHADLAIGKMKMGYYANAQIEAMAMGVPVITWVRDDLMHPDLAASALIISSLSNLGDTVRRLVDHPEILADHARRARASIEALHDSKPVIEQLKRAYGWAGE